MSLKRKILKETFENSFEISMFTRFVKEFFNEPELINPMKKKTGIWREYTEHIASYREVAKYRDNENNKVIILAVEINKDKSIERARSIQRNFISKILDINSEYTAAIVAFYSENEPSWRLSLVRLDYEFTTKGVILELTPARRYSYLVGKNEPNHTAQAQLLPIFEDEKHNPTLDEIEKAFSVEKVTKEFFEMYKNKYYDLKEYLDGNKEFLEEAAKRGFDSEQFAKKLMGQLAFLYFLQKKGWLGVKILPEDRQIPESEFSKIFSEQDKAGKEVLLTVFPNVSKGIRKVSTYNLSRLTDEEGEELAGCFKGTEYDMPWGSGTKTFIRDLFTHCEEKTNKNFFDDFLEPLFYDALNKKRGNFNYFQMFNCKIPFLNGGLFEPIEHYEWKKVSFDIPNNIFSNRKEKGRDNGDGILDIFDLYNFTINEDEPLEKEVAVDPEMLGKIFENLLDAKDRKSKGAFYTPREIVHYMCQESLINHLVSEVGVPYGDMKEFILYGELIKDEDNRKGAGFEKDYKIPKSIMDNIKLIDRVLFKIRVADLAVGSGAFPLGMLNEIVRARLNISEYLIKFLKSDEEKKIFRKNRHPYKIKWDTIKNSIFAVDIESSAIDIAKLRLWLSLVVDQEIDEDNPYPHALPNLDCNILCGNSLVEEFEGIKLFDESLLEKREITTGGEPIAIQLSLFQDQIEIMLDDLFVEQDRLFEEEDINKKTEIKKRIDEKTRMIIEAKLSRDNNASGLKRYQETMKQKTKPYFIWKLEFARVFKEKGGFDILIGNPPYVDSEEMVKTMPELRLYLSSNYSTAKGNWDLYIPFWEKAASLINITGNATLITPNKWLAIKYGEVLRNYLFEKIYNITDYSTFKAFETADISTVVVFVSNVLSKRINVIKFNSTFTIDCEYVIPKEKIKELDNLSLCLSNSFSTLEKIIKYSIISKNFTLEEAATVSETYEIANYLTDCQDEYKSKYFKFINTGTIDKYRSLWGIEQMTYVKEKYLKPIILKEDVEVNFKRRYSQALSPKIITTGIRYFECYLDDKGEYLAAKSTVIIREKNNLKLAAILPILNSNLVYYFLKEAYSGLAMGGGVNFTANNLSKIPIPDFDEQQVERLIKYTNIMQSYYIENDYNSAVVTLDEIDVFVYSLYNLDEQDIKILEEFKIKNKRKR